jgi:FdhD protein
MRGSVSEAFLLCGGDSKRLGFPKEMIRVDGAPLAVSMVAELQSLFQEVAVVSNRSAYLEHWLGVPLHADAFPGLGPLAGIHTGLRRARSGRAFFLACDMPFVTHELVQRILDAAAPCDAPAVVARTPRGPEPLCGVYAADLLDSLEQRLEEGEHLSAWDFVGELSACYVDVAEDEVAALRDIDSPADVGLLAGKFGEVEPLPIEQCSVNRVGGRALAADWVAREQPFVLEVNGVKLVTILCMPSALRELALGFCSYLGLAVPQEPGTCIGVDYPGHRVCAALPASDEAIRRAARLQVSSTCGANVFGPSLADLGAPAFDDAFAVAANHVLDALRGLRARAPVFERTGATHQAAFTDGQRVLHFAEDVGRHNAVDKVIGHCMTAGTDTRRGALLVTGRLNGQVVIKALRRSIPVLASRSAPTSNAVSLALDRGLTLIGFARGGRLNVYSGAHRVRR